MLSLIGAGGIGQTLFHSLNSFAFSQTVAIVITIAVSWIDIASQIMRSRLT